MEQTMSDNDQVKGEAPRYKLTEKAYIDDVLYEADAVITFHGIPCHYMEPVNAAAKTAKKSPEGVKASKFLDPILAMTNISGPTGVPDLAEVLAAALAKALPGASSLV